MIWFSNTQKQEIHLHVLCIKEFYIFFITVFKIMFILYLLYLNIWDFYVNKPGYFVFLAKDLGCVCLDTGWCVLYRLILEVSVSVLFLVKVLNHRGSGSSSGSGQRQHDSPFSFLIHIEILCTSPEHDTSVTLLFLPDSCLCYWEQRLSHISILYSV